MGLIEAIILGIVQGLTEFLPVSSSGHIEIAKSLLGISKQEQNLLMTIVLHAATAPVSYTHLTLPTTERV